MRFEVLAPLFLIVISPGMGCSPGNRSAEQDAVARAHVLFVDARVEGGDGSSWKKAFRNLQDALDNAGSGTEIWVARGTYVPTRKVNGEEERHRSFQLLSGVSLYGGFAGNESSRDERDRQANESILSGDLAGNDEGFSNNEENSFHVLTGTGTDRTAVLDGFVVSGGNANRREWPDDGGGGMTNFEGSPTIRNCTFRYNAAFADGGGMRNWAGSHPLVYHCTFRGNRAEQEGGGIMSGIGSHPTVQNCRFEQNEAGEDGGGMYSNMLSNSRVYNCLFIENKAGLTGGGMYNVNGSTSRVINCTFHRNEADKAGGAISNKDSDPIITNCILWENKAPVDPDLFNEASDPIVWFSLLSEDYPGLGNINGNPLFADPDRRLSPGSPAIDAGDDSALPNDISIDMDDNPRVSGERVDLGAYEHANRD